jgi:hypothetical protein
VIGVVNSMSKVIQSLGNQINEQEKQTVDESTASSRVSVEVSSKIEDNAEEEVPEGGWAAAMGPDIVNK